MSKPKYIYNRVLNPNTNRYVLLANAAKYGIDISDLSFDAPLDVVQIIFEALDETEYKLKYTLITLSKMHYEHLIVDDSYKMEAYKLALHKKIVSSRSYSRDGSTRIALIEKNGGIVTMIETSKYQNDTMHVSITNYIYNIKYNGKSYRYDTGITIAFVGFRKFPDLLLSNQKYDNALTLATMMYMKSDYTAFYKDNINNFNYRVYNRIEKE